VKNEDVQDIRLYLEDRLTKNSASLPNLKEVAIELGCSVSVLRHHCPDLSKLFVSRRRRWSEDFFKKAQIELEAALTSVEAVPLSNVLQSLGCDRDVMERYFPDLCRRIVTRYQERFDYKKIQKCLQDAVADDKAISVAEIARDLGCKSSYLYGPFPDLCKQIATQRRVKLKRQHENRVENTRVEIKQAILALHEQDIFPSDKRIKCMLSDPHMVRRKEGRETLSMVLKEFGYSTNVGGAE
jgi:AraC-like DNA-binding protein